MADSIAIQGKDTDRTRMERFVRWVKKVARKDTDSCIPTDVVTSQRCFTVIDAYGTAWFEHEGEKVYVLDTYGEEDVAGQRWKRIKGRFLVYVACLLSESGHIEAADLVIDQNTGEIAIENYRWGTISVPWIHIRNKRAFYFYPDENYLGLKTKEGRIRVPMNQIGEIELQPSPLS